ncbi:MAG: hypothetical protein JO352_31990 [Chloroflexi bacterium]|nr:hypothetical protein [Chloroflexota bacterium]MBV9598216.1 hypothetical protein [Chloroflexota bacterium]
MTRFALRRLDIKLLGLVVSVGAAVGLRFFSDFSFATIEHQAALASLSISRFSIANLGSLTLNSLGYQLERDWFNLTPQAPAEVIGIIVLLVVAYILLRLAVSPTVAAVIVMFGAPFIGIGATLSACMWVLARAVPAT